MDEENNINFGDIKNRKIYEFYLNKINKEGYNEEELMDFIPELKPMKGFDQKHPRHRFDLWEHTLYAMSLSNPDIEIRLALLLHDIGKVDCFTEENGVRHYKGHPTVSCEKAKVILDRLDYKNEEFVSDICYLIKNHDMPISKKLIEERPDLAIKLYEIQKCDVIAHNREHQESREAYMQKVMKLLMTKQDYML